MSATLPPAAGFVARLRARVGNAGSLHRNVGWVGAAEVMNRVSRLVTAIVMARVLSAHDYGVAAIVLTTFELIRVLTSNGLGAKIIQAGDDELDAVCNTVYRLNWLFSGTLLLLQIALAFPVAWFYGDSEIAWMLVALAGVYLLYPFALVSAFLLQRDERLKVTALAMGLTVSLDNLLVAGFALTGFGAWAVVWPKLLTAPAWIFICLRRRPWRPRRGAGMSRAGEVLGFGKHVLGAEVLKALRLHADNLIVGATLGLEALGIYYFARNAGIGLSTALLTAYSTAVLPHLAAARGCIDALRERYRRALKLGLVGVPAIILLQTLLAPLYVPLVFGQRWVDAGALPVLILLCLSALTRPVAECTSQLLRTLDAPQVDLYWGVGFTLLFLVAALAGVGWGLSGIAASIMTVHLAAIPLYGVWAYRRFLAAPAPRV